MIITINTMLFSSSSAWRHAAARRLVHTCAVAWQSDLAEEMVQYVRSSCMGNAQQALDILSSGLSMPQADHHQRAQFYLSMAEVHSAHSTWASALEAYTQCIEEASSMPSPSHTLLAEGHLGASRAMVVLGHDTDALTAAQAARNAGAGIAEQGDGTMAAWRYAANGMAAQVVAEQAAGAWGDAGDTCRRIMALLHQCPDPVHQQPHAHDGMVVNALLTIAMHMLATGDVEQGQAWVARARSAAAAAVGHCHVQQGKAGRSPVLAGQCVAEAALAGVQLHMRQDDWKQAEEGAGEDALPATEAAWGAQGGPVALPLLLSAEAYRRAGKVVFAEGLYRECLKLCSMPKDAASIPADLTQILTHQIPAPPMHPSIPGMAAWRLAQLLSALPNRGTEVEQFARLGQGLLGEGQHVEEWLGSLQAWQGKDENKGGFPLVSLWSMRMFVV